MNITCVSCQKLISDDSKFCEHCGEKVQHKEPEHKKTDGIKFSTKSKEASKVVDHLEFLGYSISDNGSKDDLVKFIAFHKVKNNLFVNYSPATGFIVYTMFSLNQEKISKKRKELLEILNKANNFTHLCAFSISEGEQPSLISATWYPPEYSKSTFSDFLDLFEQDTRRGLNTEGLTEFG
ncbi:hypothetical protein A2415_01165 [candidate division WWE3 bacterium RIFOXYC1_FULL_39_7]|uniref:Zinc-ribbon domain-containing protein n=2 Tax=Katanobacteria TaxID=422282 RepID=A0A1F4XB72_UNCKA|nr:MAG: hypothetical protein A2415_01165 [candidate division WWE3 bacterium RIFOXYC1_FULL_39_7]OGC78313.1 MAG: hypothetical protein A2619_04085 [candidate division WWE3 bacterium RIFOXYD1_FULL_39_9]